MASPWSPGTDNGAVGAMVGREGSRRYPPEDDGSASIKIIVATEAWVLGTYLGRYLVAG